MKEQPQPECRETLKQPVHLNNTIHLYPKQEMYLIRRNMLRPTFDGRRLNGKGSQTKRGI